MTRRHRKPPKPRHVDSAPIVAAPGPHVADHAAPATTAGLPMSEAAQALEISTSTLRRWVAAGAPVSHRGARGRGRATMVCPESIRAWRGAGGREKVLVELAAELPELIANAMAAAFAQMSAGCHTGGERRRVAGALGVGWFTATAGVLDRLHHLHPAIEPDPRSVPETIQRLRKIAAR